jgi:hypothetical protein
MLYIQTVLIIIIINFHFDIILKMQEMFQNRALNGAIRLQAEEVIVVEKFG